MEPSELPLDLLQAIDISHRYAICDDTKSLSNVVSYFAWVIVYHSTSSAFMTNKTPSCMESIMNVPNQKVVKWPKSFSSSFFLQMCHSILREPLTVVYA